LRVHSFVPYDVVTRAKNVEKRKLIRTFYTARATSVPISVQSV